MISYKLSPQAEDDLYLIWLYGLNNWGIEAAINISQISSIPSIRSQRALCNTRLSMKSGRDTDGVLQEKKVFIFGRQMKVWR
ncbi:MAG: hypothetical protein COB09_12815 [Thalassobium sp.]|nr:MAG: hypothetical protein COB09_12815 [Thalassobium sp.]